MAQRAVVMPRFTCKIGDAIEIDAVLDESHTLTNTVTDHPVEEGFNITDHSRPDPDQVTLTCFISNTPISDQQQERTVREGSVDFTTAALQDTEFSVVAGRGNDAYKKLKKLRDEGTLVQVVTTLTTYVKSSTSGMIIQSLTIPRTAKDIDGLAFTIVLKQIRIVKNRQTQDTTPKDKRTAKKKDKGEQTTKDTDDASPEYKAGKYLSQGTGAQGLFP